jgi:hypothetical protein
LFYGGVGVPPDQPNPEARLRVNPVGARAKGTARTELCQPSCGHFQLLSSLTWVSRRWESTFISGVLPADCDSSVQAMCLTPQYLLHGQLLLLYVFSFAGVVIGCSHIFQL